MFSFMIVAIVVSFSLLLLLLLSLLFPSLYSYCHGFYSFGNIAQALSDAVDPSFFGSGFGEGHVPKSAFYCSFLGPFRRDPQKYPK